MVHHPNATISKVVALVTLFVNAEREMHELWN